MRLPGPNPPTRHRRLCLWASATRLGRAGLLSVLPSSPPLWTLLVNLSSIVGSDSGANHRKSPSLSTGVALLVVGNREEASSSRNQSFIVDGGRNENRDHFTEACTPKNGDREGSEIRYFAQVYRREA